MQTFLRITCVFISVFCCGTAAVEDLQPPLLKMNFDGRSAQTAPGGVGGSYCYVVPANGMRPLIVNDAKVMKKIAGARSLTVCGWVKRPMAFDDVTSKPFFLLSAPGVFEMKYTRWGNLLLEMVEGDGSKQKAYSSGFSTGILSCDDQWVFVAFTYDTTRSEQNYAFYYGSERYPIMRDVIGTIRNSGALSGTLPPFLAIGAQDASGKEALNGRLDSVKIFASQEDGSAALSQSEIERIRLSDIGKDRVREIALQVAEEKESKQIAAMQMEDEFWSEKLNMHQVDPLLPNFSNKCPKPVDQDFLPDVPRGGTLPIAFVAMFREKKEVTASVDVLPVRSGKGNELKSTPRIYEIIHIPVEANNNGGVATAIDTRPPAMWQDYQIAKAPFMVGEVLNETSTFKLRVNKDHDLFYKEILVDFKIPASAEPGIYHSSLVLHAGGESVEVPFSFQVANVVLSDFPRLDNTYWVTALPQNLTTRSEPPEIWSEEHWKLIRNSAKTLRDFGQTATTVNLIFPNAELANFIQPYIKKDGTYRFDYAIFDRWFKLFLDLGFRQIEGKQFFGGHDGGVREVYAIDENTGEKIRIFHAGSDVDDYFDFLKIFASDLAQHLNEKGWQTHYVQTLMDEPGNLELYKRASRFAKEYLPGIPVKEACGNTAYSDYIDIQVFTVYLALESYQKLAVRRREEGRSVWYYNCCTPYPSFPNRHLDEPLAGSRLYPWLCYLLNADGYLYWAANNYRFADPYKSSIGPLPNGSTYPGHPPGDNWMYYPGPDGLRGSLRMLAFREGLLDHTLLMQLAEKDPERVDQILKTIVRNPKDFSRDPADFYAARRTLLDALEGK